MIVIGFDTSNYTTSISYFDGQTGENCSKLLPVKDGQLGLRQSDAVFQHIKSLPELSDRLFSDIDINSVQAIGVSTRPRDRSDSYMPCFLVGYTHARMLSDALHVPLFECSHQQGHIAACAWSAGRMDLLEMPHLAWHLSGGTTELLLVEPENKNVKCTIIGGTTDISTGQLIDRTGQMLSLSFPSGKQLDALSCESDCNDFYPVKSENSFFSLSGMQNKLQKYYGSGADRADTAAYCLRSICYAIKNATNQAFDRYPHLPIVFSGGVASNSLLRKELLDLKPIFAQPRFSTDNAMGVAVLTYLSLGV